MKLPNLVNPSTDWLSKSLKSDFQSEFFMSKIIWIVLIFSMNNTCLVAHFLLKSFFDNFNCLTTLLLKSCPIFNKLSADRFTKFHLNTFDFWSKILLFRTQTACQARSKYSLLYYLLTLKKGTFEPSAMPLSSSKYWG